MEEGVGRVGGEVVHLMGPDWIRICDRYITVGVIQIQITTVSRGEIRAIEILNISLSSDRCLGCSAFSLR